MMKRFVVEELEGRNGTTYKVVVLDDETLEALRSITPERWVVSNETYDFIVDILDLENQDYYTLKGLRNGVVLQMSKERKSREEDYDFDNSTKVSMITAVIDNILMNKYNCL